MDTGFTVDMRIICHCNASYYELGMKEHPTWCSWAYRHAHECKNPIRRLDDYEEYHFHASAFPYRWCMPIFLYPSRKCVVCGISCPHGESDMPVDRYLCLGCKGLSLFEEG
jgi:hypothetical protein